MTTPPHATFSQDMDSNRPRISMYTLTRSLAAERRTRVCPAGAANGTSLKEHASCIVHRASWFNWWW